MNQQCLTHLRSASKHCSGLGFQRFVGKLHGGPIFILKFPFGVVVIRCLKERYTRLGRFLGLYCTMTNTSCQYMPSSKINLRAQSKQRNLYHIIIGIASHNRFKHA